MEGQIQRPDKQATTRRARRRGARAAFLAVALGVAAVGALGGCARSPTELPDAKTMPTRTAADAERARHAKSMSETQSAAAERQSGAIKKIEGSQ